MSKIKFLIGTLAVAVLAGAITVSAACSDLATSATMRVGSRGANVQELQKIVGVTADGAYGPMTAAAVKAFQASNALVADGVAGPKTLAVMLTKCGTTPVVTTPVTTIVSGEAGDLSVDDTSKDVEDSMKEGEEDVNVLGFKVEADDSDISITNIKVWLQNDGTDTDSSERLTNYIDEVKVFLGDEEVGSADASDFSRDTGDLDEFEKSIALSGAVVKEGDTEYLYVAVSAGSIDTEDVDAQWNIAATSMRYTDGTGAIMSADVDTSSTPDAVAANVENFGFNDEDADDDLNIKTSSANPAAATIGVDADDETEDVLIGAFKFEVPEDSSDISILELPIVVSFDANDDVNADGDEADTVDTPDDFAEDVITELYVKIDGEKYTADLDSSDDETANGEGDATYYVTFEEDEMVIGEDEEVEVKVYASFDSQDDNYAEGTKVQATVTGSLVEAEGVDEMDADNTFTGKIHTLSAVDIEVTKSTSSVAYTDDDDHSLVEYKLEVKIANNGDDDIYVPFGASLNNAITDEGLGFILETTSGVEFDYASASIEASVEADDASIEEDYSFLVAAGEDQILILTVTVDNASATAGYYRLVLSDFQYASADDNAYEYDGTTPEEGETAISDLADDLSDVRTATKYITADAI